MSGAQSISTRRAYGVQRVCRVWHRARSSVYARRQATRSPALCRRRGPIGAAPDDVLVAHLRRVLEASPFHGEGDRKAWAKLRVAGVRTSKERVRRLMREHDLQAPPRAGHAHGPKAHDGTITTEAPDVMWGTDMTATVTVAEGTAFVFVAVDHCATACIGLHAAKRGTRFEALEPIRQGIQNTLEKAAARQRVRELVCAELDPLIEAQIQTALGVRHFVVREKDGKFKRVTDPATITAVPNHVGPIPALESRPR